METMNSEMQRDNVVQPVDENVETTRAHNKAVTANNSAAKMPLNVSPQAPAKGLGWFSIGLGLAELLAPKAVAKIAGAKGDRTGLTRFYGLREIGSGLAIFAQPNSAAAVWSRVAGDAVDLATLGAAFASPEINKGRAAFATASVLGVTALDILCAQQLSQTETTH